MRLTVHIGTTKTGSTSIQAFLRANRAALLARGFCVPESLGAQDHRHAALSCLNFGQSGDLMKRQGLTDAAMLEKFRDQTRAAYLAELETARARHGAREVIITSEHLQSRCSQPRNLIRFRDLFATGFDDLRILVYVRPQFDQMISLYSTMLRNGFADTIDEHVARHMTDNYFTYFDLEGILARWSQVFGADRLEVRPYKALPPPDQGGVVADFCALLGLDPADPGLTRPADSNSSIHAGGQELLRLFNLALRAGSDPATALEGWIATEAPARALAPRAVAGLRQILSAPALSPTARRARLVRWVETHCSGKGAEASLAQARAFQARFDAGNAAVIARHFAGHPDYLEPRWPRA